MRRAVPILGLTLLASIFATPVYGGAGGHCDVDGITDRRTNVVDMEGSCFTPTVTRIDTGETVTWINKDPYPHTVTGSGYLWGDVKEYAGGERVSHRFTEDGVFPYACLVHPGMVGAVVVGAAVVGDGIGTAKTAGIVPSEQEPPVPEDTAADPLAESDPSSPALWIVGLGVVVVLAGGLITFEMRRRARRQVEVPA